MKWGGVLALVAMAPAIVLAQKQVERRFSERQREDVLYVWSGKQLRAFAPGFEDLLADIYWLRTVQYFGGQRAYAEHPDFNLLLPLTEITTELDPRLEVAYRYGAIFLSEPFPNGAGRPRDGITLLERGCAAMPEAWRLRQDLGFFHFIYLKDAATAARILLEASNIPGAAFWLKSLAARTLERGGERQQARSMWRAMYDQGEDGGIRENARANLQVLDALDERDAIQGFVTRFHERFNRNPASLQELAAAGLPRKALIDPSGTEYAYDPVSGKVNVAASSRLHRPADEVR